MRMSRTRGLSGSATILEIKSEIYNKSKNHLPAHEILFGMKIKEMVEEISVLVRIQSENIGVVHIYIYLGWEANMDTVYKKRHNHHS